MVQTRTFVDSMQSSVSSRFLRLFPSLTDFAFLAPILLLFARLDGVKTMLGDGDTGWHIRAGDWMLANGRVPSQDLFSFTKSDSPWFAWEWLSEVILAALHQSFGLAGPVVLGIVLLCITSALLFRLCRRQTGNDLIAIAVTVVAMAASSIHWLARPHLFTLLLLVITLHILDRSRQRPNLLWWLVPMVAVWANLHGAFLVAIVILLTCGLGAFLRAFTEPSSELLRSAMHASRLYFQVAAACAAASLLNPYGWNLHVHIYQYLTERYHFDHIIEFQTLSFHSAVAIFYEMLIIFGLLAAARCLSRRQFTEALLLLSWLHMSLIAGRNIPIFSFLAAPLVTRYLTESISKISFAAVAPWLRKFASSVESFAVEFSRTDRIPRWHVVSFGAICLLFVLIVTAPEDSTKWKAQFDPASYPASALPLLDGKRVFTNDEWGDYLIYKLYPGQKVFVDGRSDFYGPEFCLEYLSVMNAKWNWAATLNKHQVDAVLLPVDSPLAAVLKGSPNWKPVFDDHIAILFFATGRPDRGVSGSRPSQLQLSDVGKPDPGDGSVLGLAALSNPGQ